MPSVIVPVTVPPSGDGPIASIANLVGPKTVELSGFYQGSYTLLASHDNTTFAPVLLFNSNGLDSIKETLSDSYSSVRVRANANTVPASTVAVNISGVTNPGANQFASLATLPAGFVGTTAPVDLYALFPPTGLETAINIICKGSLSGTILVEGSMDGVGFNNVGVFQAGPQQRPLLGLPTPLDFAPLSTGAQVRYLRFTVSGQLAGQVDLTIGGAIATSSVIGSATLGVSSAAGRAAIEKDTVVSTEVILFEWEASANGLPANVSAQLNVIEQVLPAPNAPTGILRVYIGATNPGNTAGATLVLTVAGLVNNTETGIAVTSVPFPAPVGRTTIQITGQVTAPGPGKTNELDARGVSINIG